MSNPSCLQTETREQGRCDKRGCIWAGPGESGRISPGRDGGRKTFPQEAIVRKVRKSREVDRSHWSRMNYSRFIYISSSQISGAIRLAWGACENADAWVAPQTCRNWCCGDGGGRLENLHCFTSFFGWFWHRWLLTILSETLILGFCLLVQMCSAGQSNETAGLPHSYLSLSSHGQPLTSLCHWDSG